MNVIELDRLVKELPIMYTSFRWLVHAKGNFVPTVRKELGPNGALLIAAYNKSQAKRNDARRIS